jgi:predicted anti-sigma-YlaC factor YlaD
MSCDAFLDRAEGFLAGSLPRPDHESILLHLARCASCRALHDALTAACDPELAERILARTSGAACETARSRLCDRVDGELGSFDTELVDGHLLHCPECASLARSLAELTNDLPLLAAVDPGPEFVPMVLARTSRRPRRAPLSRRWAAFTSRLLDRPRIALEGAFVFAVVVGLPFAVAPAPIAGDPAHALPEARVAMSDIEAKLQVGARSAWGNAQAFVVESSMYLRHGTFARVGASGQKGDKTQEDRR